MATAAATTTSYGRTETATVRGRLWPVARIQTEAWPAGVGLSVQHVHGPAGHPHR